jgi:CDP-paratose 2-epimerase
MQKWLVIGGAGFIGAQTAARLLELGQEVVVIDNLERKGAKENLVWLRSHGLKHFTLVNIENQNELIPIFKLHSDVDVVLHLAAQVAVTKSIENPRHDFMVNALGTLNVLECARTLCKKNPAFLYSSTNKVYGSLEHLHLITRENRVEMKKGSLGISEEVNIDFHSPYGCSKGTADQYVRDYSRIYNLKTVVFRQSCIYGTRQWGEEDQGWIAWFCRAAQANLPLTIYGDGKQVRDALWITDLIDLYMTTVQNIDDVSGEIFNVGGGIKNVISPAELVIWIEKKLGKKLPVSYEEARAGDQKYFVSDVTKAAKLLGWKPKVSLSPGLEELWDWLESQPKAQAA